MHVFVNLYMYPVILSVSEKAYTIFHLNITFCFSRIESIGVVLVILALLCLAADIGLTVAICTRCCGLARENRSSVDPVFGLEAGGSSAVANVTVHTIHGQCQPTAPVVRKMRDCNFLVTRILVVN